MDVDGYGDGDGDVNGDGNGDVDATRGGRYPQTLVLRRALIKARATIFLAEAIVG